MNLNLEAARQNVEKYRFTEDYISNSFLDDQNMISQLEAHFSHSDLRISKDMTPGLDSTIQSVLQQLKIPKETINSFVYSSNEINAQCFSGDSNETIIRFSSRLIELLEADELKFIIGHELGHFLFGHNCQGNLKEDTSVDLEESLLINARAQELSSDRIGFLACEDINSAVRAMIKVASGLSNKYLRFDVSAFLNQLDQTSNLQKYNSQLSSHPSMWIRCKALFWFSSSVTDSSQDLEKIDNRIINDLTKYVDGDIRKKVDGLKNDYKYWYTASKIIIDNKFDKNEQEVVKTIFGNKKFTKLKAFLNNNDDISNIRNIIVRNKESFKKRMIDNIPNKWREELSKIEESIDQQLDC